MQAQVIRDGKKLYHVQAVTEWSDSPYDIFLFADHYPTDEEVRQAYIKDRDIEPEDIKDNTEIEDFAKYYEVYSVWAEEI